MKTNFPRYACRAEVFAFLVILFGSALSHAMDSQSTLVDFRYSPPEWQTSICLPDDPDKTLVDRSGDLLYHYGKGGRGREFGTRIAVHVVTNVEWQSQKLESPRVPIVQTRRGAAGLDIVEEAFAATPIDAASSLLPPRRDVVLVHVRNTGSQTKTFLPRLIVDTSLGFKFQRELNQVSINETDSVTASLPMSGLVDERGSQRTIELGELSVPSGQEAAFFVVYNNGGQAAAEPKSVEEASAMRTRAVGYWQNAALPYGHIEVPDPGIQALVDSSIRNIWQAREIKKGLPAFQVGPTCYRGLWIVDGAFLLESAALLGAGKEARSGVAYELTFQKPDGQIHVMDNYSKENGIVLWTCVRHAQLTQDKAWLESIWPKLERIAEYIRTLRQQTLTNASPRDDGLLPAGFPDGGIGGVVDEYTNPYWNLAGLHAFIQAAHWLGKNQTAVQWQREYDEFLNAFRRAAQRDMKCDPHGHLYLPARMDGQDLPQRGQWAFCHAVYPGEVFAKDDPLVAGMLQVLQETEREGMVYGTGWDPTGIWNYFASFYGHAWLWQGNGPKAAQVLTAYANHAAPTLVWREEQSLRGEHFKKVGDMPHNWASAEFIRLVVHLLALDRGDELHLLQGLPNEWTGASMVTRLNKVATSFGALDMTLTVNHDGRSATLSVNKLGANCKTIIVHLPQGGTRTISPKRAATINFPVQQR